MLVETSRIGNLGANAQVGARSRISFGAIVAGVMVTLIAQIMMTLLGLGIGMGVVDFQTAGSNEATGIGIASGIWWLISGTIALYLGGWVAGRLAGMPRSLDGALHGILTWALASLFSLFLVTSTVGSFLNGSTQMLSQGVRQISVASPEMGKAAESAMKEAGLNPDRAESEVKQAGREAVTATKKVGEGDIRNAATTAARGTGAAAFWAFGILLVGMISAAAGGRSGSPPDYEETTEVERIDP